jgi:hypothetical protein
MVKLKSIKDCQQASLLYIFVFFFGRQAQSQSLWKIISVVFCNPVYLNIEYLSFLYGVFQSLVLFFILFCTFFVCR